MSDHSGPVENPPLEPDAEQFLLALLDVERSEQDIRLSRAPLLPQLDLSASVGGGYNGSSRALTYTQDASGTYFPVTVDVPSSSSRSYGASSRSVWT